MPDEREILVFGGTVEGRRLVEWLAGRASCRVTAYSATGYGSELLPEHPRVNAVSARLDEPAMVDLMERTGYLCVVDATHPYAEAVSENIASAARVTGTPLVRLLREEEPEGPWRTVATAVDAADYLSGTVGNILLATGAKELHVFTERIPDFEERLYARILPVADSVEQAHHLGIPVSHLIAMQGPFSQEMNVALMREFDIRLLVTKASGRSGGFDEKVKAARDCDVELVVIHRPEQDETGLRFEDALVYLEENHGL